MTFHCDICERAADQYVRYIIHLQLAHPTGALARAVEPTLFGNAILNEAPAAQPRVWDRWDQGGKSGPATRRPGP